MNNTQYIAALKKALSGLDKASQTDIVQEISSHAAESGDSLIERFGSPEQLASQYLDGEIIATPLRAKIWGISKKVFITIGMLVVALIALISTLVWWWTRDAFNYADESALQLHTQQAAWQSIAWASDLDIHVERATAVFYWHDEPTIRHNCHSKDPVQVTDKTVRFSNAKCFVYLPKVATTLTAEQAEVVLVRPTVSLDIEIKQTQLEVAADGEKIQYRIDGTRSSIDKLPSTDDAEIRVNINATEANIGTYSY